MTIDNLPDERSALGQFRALVMADEMLAAALAEAVQPDRFVELIVRSAGARGISLRAETVRNAIRPDPLGLARWFAAPAIGSRWPSRQWLPIDVSARGGQMFVDWAYFGAGPLTAPFFEDSIHRALILPFNRIFRYRMTIGDFLDRGAYEESLTPSGFIFHMSRCGSTLVSQMLRAMPENTMISEAAPIDAIVRISRAWPDLAGDLHRNYLRAMIAAFGRRRSGGERDFFIKLDSWHTLALPLFRRAFPSVPWVFLYRDPVEVMVSQIRRRGTQTVPEIMPASFYGIDGADDVPAEEYCARVLNRICTAVVDNLGAGGGLLVNYRELPGAIATAILPHFGVAFGERERNAMNLAARYDAKAPGFEFANDSEAKQREAAQSIRALADRHLGDVYRQLEGLRVEGLRAGAKPY